MAVSVETERAELATSRALVYGVLASLYSRPAGAPELEVLRRWCDIEGDHVGDILPGVARRGLDSISAWFGRADGVESPGEDSVSLESEFVCLFRGLRRGTSPPPPYESVYMDGGHVYGPSTDLVGRTYDEFSLGRQDNEPPDHLALELDFMRFLCEEEAEAWQSGEVPQYWLLAEQRFLGEHLGRWASAFCGKVREWCRTGFYSGVVDITESWISCDQDVIAGLVEIERDDMVLR